jgi:hypothetical protein
MVGGLINGAILVKVMGEDMLPLNAHSHVLIRTWLNITVTVLAHHQLECVAESIWRDPLPILNPQVAVGKKWITIVMLSVPIM